MSEEFIFKKPSQLNPYQNTGLSEILARFLKEGAYFVNMPVTFSVYMSISDTFVPVDMKIAMIKPIYKNNCNLDVGNYKPFSILSVGFEILEKAIYIQTEASLVKIILFIITNLGSEVPSLQILAFFVTYYTISDY